MSGAHYPDRTAVLVVRAWLHGAPPRLVARISYKLDIERDELITRTAGGVDEIAAAVRRWLDEASDSPP